jgi:hypothetical protein
MDSQLNRIIRRKNNLNISYSFVAISMKFYMQKQIAESDLENEQKNF